MTRLPVPGQDSGSWGNILNDFLSVDHNSDGTLKTSGTLNNYATTSSVSAKADDSAVVHNTGAETIAGTKTFSASPVVPAPSLGSHATTKTYVDAAVPAAASSVTDETTYGVAKTTGVGTTYARADHSHGTPPLPSTPVAEDQGAIAWAFDPVNAVSFTATASGQLSLVKIILRKPATLTNVIYAIANAGSGITSNQNFIGLYDSSGNRVALTADQSANFAGTGVITAAWTAPYSAAAGFYWVGILTNASGSPNLARAGASATANLASLGQAAALRRFGSFGSSLTSLPSSFTPSSIAAVTNATFWVAVS